MSSTALNYLSANRLVSQLEDRCARRGLSKASCLFITCEEEVGLVKSPHEARIPDAVSLGTPGASVDDPDLVEAIEYAVRELGVERVVVAAHSLCDQLHEDGGHEGDDWVTNRILRANRLMESAREQVRQGVAKLASDPAIAELGVSIAGVVRAVESGVYYMYYRDRDTFEAML